MTSPAMGRFGCGYLVLWFLVFAVAIFVGEPTMVWLADALSAVPTPLVVVLSWLPFGLIILCLLADAMRTTAPPMRQPWVGLLACLGLVMAFQVPVVFQRRPGDAYEMAAATTTGRALIAGAVGAYVSVLLLAFVFMTWRWLRGRIRGQKVPFADNSWGMQPESRRRFAIGASIAAVLGLVVSLAAV